MEEIHSLRKVFGVVLVGLFLIAVADHIAVNKCSHEVINLDSHIAGHIFEREGHVTVIWVGVDVNNASLCGFLGAV